MSIPVLLLILACGTLFGCRKSGGTRSSTSDKVPQEERDEKQTYSNEYRKMFGAIAVPTYRGLDEPEAPEPLIFVVTDLDGKILGFRQPNSELGHWGFDEISVQAIASPTEGKTSRSLIIAADKTLTRSRFLEVLETVKDSSGMTALWIQVWGVHPYPLQIHVDVADIDALKTEWGACQNLQEIIDRLSQIR